MRRITSDTYSTIFQVAYLGMGTNALLALGTLPLLAVLVLTDPARSWLVLAVLAPSAAPALAAASAVFAAFTADSSVGVVRTFVAAYRATWRRALAVGALVVPVVVVLGVDLRWAWDLPVAPIALPLLAVLLALTVGTGLLALVAVAEAPGARLRDVLRAAAYLAVRRWYLTIASLAVAALFVSLLTAKPAIAIGLAAAPLLYTAWANSRFSLRPVLPVPDATSA